MVENRTHKSEVLRRERIVMAEMEKLLAAATEEDLRKALEVYGIKPGSPQYQQIFQIWREL